MMTARRNNGQSVEHYDAPPGYSRYGAVRSARSIQTMPAHGLRQPRGPINQMLGCNIRIIYYSYIFLSPAATMGIVNIDEDLHDQLRRACTVTNRSINAQANFWIKVGMLCEMNPELSFQQIVANELRAAGVQSRPLRSGRT